MVTHSNLYGMRTHEKALKPIKIREEEKEREEKEREEKHINY